MSRDVFPSYVESPRGKLSVVVDGPTSADVVVVLAHGAGGGLHSEFMTTVARGLGAKGSLVCRFNFPYTEQGRKAPDREPVLEESWRAVAATVADTAAGRTLVLGGKSMGGRIASHVIGDTSAAGLVFLGYPLHAPRRTDRLRAGHLEHVGVPMLFVSGTRDPLCSLPHLRSVLEPLGRRAQLAVIDGGDHSFKTPRGSGRSTGEAWAEVVDVTASWVADLRV
jgi:predicted alpha/beta-hydrolase family hydrolase